ncbi:hypothetical protein ACFL6S_17685, partial [Candidatus Poribacteria bacterium]
MKPIITLLLLVNMVLAMLAVADDIRDVTPSKHAEDLRMFNERWPKLGQTWIEVNYHHQGWWLVIAALEGAAGCATPT